MKVTLSKRRLMIAALAPGMAICLSVAGCGGSESSVPAGTATDTRVYAPDSAPFGKTYAEWSAAWWQWMYAFPQADNPVMDRTGAKGALRQAGPVWFLVGTFGGTAQRTLTVPADTALLLPLMNSAWIFTDPGDTDEAAIASVTESMQYVTEMYGRLDGVSLVNLRAFRFRSPFFNVTFDSQDPVYPGVVGEHRTLSEGYWVMLKPLSRGAHIVEFGGKRVRPAPPPENQSVWETGTTYELTVQ